MSSSYEPAPTTRPQTREWDDNFSRMFGRKPCRGCGAKMDSEPEDALWCSECKRKDGE